MKHIMYLIRYIILVIILLANITTGFAQSKNKKPLQKRENYEFTFDLPRYVEQLKKVIALTFKEADKPIISKNRLIKGLKYHLGVNEKMALKLIAKARQEDLIELNRDTLKSSGTVEYSKAF